MKAYIDRYCDAYGVEPICKVLQIAPSCYRRHAAQQRNPALRCKRAQRDDALIPDIKRVWHANWQVYAADKVWKQMNCEGIRVARCTVERLMKHPGLQGVRRGKVVRTTMPDTSAPRRTGRALSNQSCAASSLTAVDWKCRRRQSLPHRRHTSLT